MADEKPTRAIRTVQGEVVRADAPGHPSPVRKTLYRLISRLSTVPFFNRMSKHSINSARDVIEAQTELGDALIRHQLGADRLTDMPTIVATARAERKAGQYEAETRRSKAEAAYEERFIDKQISQQHKDQELTRNKIADIDLDIQLQKN